METAIESSAVRVAPPFSVLAQVARQAEADERAEIEDDIVFLATRMAETFGEPILAAESAEDLADMLDMAIENVELFRLDALLGQATKPLLESAGGHLEEFEPSSRVYGDSSLVRELLADANRLYSEVVRVAMTMLPSPEDSTESETEEITVATLLPLIESPTMPLVAKRLVLDIARSVACAAALIAAEIKQEPLPEWMATALLECWRAGAHARLQFLATRPDLAVSYDVLPAAERLKATDIDAEHARHTAVFAEFNRQNTSHDPWYPIGRPDDDA